MPEQPVSERRSRERLLCSDHFEAPVLHLPEGDHIVTAINFNHLGIGLFSSRHLPPFTEAHISIRYAPEPSFQLDRIPCKMVYIQDTEVGDQYGISFKWEVLSKTTQADLMKLEEIATASMKEDRYGLF